MTFVGPQKMLYVGQYLLIRELQGDVQNDLQIATSDIKVTYLLRSNISTVKAVTTDWLISISMYSAHEKKCPFK